MGADYQLVERTGPAGRGRPGVVPGRAGVPRAAAGRVEGSAAARFFSEEHRLVLRMHRLADPAAHEVVASQHAYLAVLATAPSTAVGLAQDMLKRAVGLLDADAMIDAGAAVLTRAEKLVKAQLGLFAALRTDAGQRNRLSRIVGEALEGMPLDLAPLARKLVDSSDETQRAATDGEMGAREEGRPRQSRYRRRVANRCRICPTTLAIVDDEELHALIRAQFEGAGDGAELPRLFAYLASRPQLQLPEALRHRAAEIIESVWDERNASPRRLLAAALLGRDDVSFRAMPAMSWPARASRIPWAWHCRKTRSPAKATTWRPATGRSAIPGPPARATNICRRMRRWLCWPASFTNCGPAGCGASLSFRRWRFPSSASCGNGWWPSRAQGLFARLAGVGRRAQAVLDGGGRRFHIACPGCRRRARRIHLPRPGGAGTGRLRPGGAMDGLAAAIQPRHAGRALPSDVVRGGECDQRARPGAAAGAGRVPQGAGRTRVLGLGAGRVGEDDRAARPGGGSDRALGRRWPAGSRAVRRADRGASGGRFRLGRAAGADAGRRVIHQRARRLPRAADAGGAVAQAGRCRRQADGPGRQAHRACRAPVQRLWHADSLARHAGGAPQGRVGAGGDLAPWKPSRRARPKPPLPPRTHEE